MSKKRKAPVTEWVAQMRGLLAVAAKQYGSAAAAMESAGLSDREVTVLTIRFGGQEAVTHEDAARAVNKSLERGWIGAEHISDVERSAALKLALYLVLAEWRKERDEAETQRIRREHPEWD